jgi:hypothetical protein
MSATSRALPDIGTTSQEKGASMRRAIRSLLLTLIVVPALTLHAAVVPNGTADVRRELSAYFAGIDKNAPTVLGGLAKSPETMAAVQQRIATMSDAEVAEFRKMMHDAPDWKAAPELFAKSFPPEVLSQVRRVGSDYAARIPRGEEMRDDVRTLTKVLSLLPDEKLKELGVDRATVDALEKTIDGITPLEAAMLQRQLSERGPWEARSAAAVGAMPPALQRGAAALAQHGPLTEKDVAELGNFRSELTALLGRIDQLPDDTKKTLKIDDFRAQLGRLDAASPDMLFMVRHNVTPQMLTALEDNVAFLEQVAGLTDEELARLETFRGELTSAFEELEEQGSGQQGPGIREMLAGLEPSHLMLLEKGMSQFGRWQTALPVFYRTLASPDLAPRIALLQGPTPDPAAVAELESFRASTLVEIEAAAALPDADAQLIARARERLATLPLERLELMRMTLRNMPPTATAADRLSVVSLHEIDFNCYVSMPDPVPNISLDFICNPIEDALEAIEHSIISTVNTIVASVQSALNTAISSMSAVLNTAISAVTSTVNSLVSSITDTVTTISDFIMTIPDLAWDAMKMALDLLLDIEIRNGVTLRDLVADGAEEGLAAMKTLMGLAGDWWSAISSFTLPMIPCPPSGFHTPFGDVGDGAAADNYARYHLLIEGLIGLIPDTETSLAIKIPAQVAYMLYDFLGVCLEQAAADADAAEMTARHNLVLTNFGALETHIRTEVAGLALTNSSNTDDLTNLINGQSADVRNTVVVESAAIQELLRTRGTSTRTLISNESDEIQTLIRNEGEETRSDLDAFHDMHLRLTIERVLQAGVGREMALLQLLEPLGHLGLVGDIVRETLDAMDATSQGIGIARKSYDEAVALMNAGREKEAFKAFSAAYRAATK